jgi:predicted dehydrogenase
MNPSTVNWGIIGCGDVTEVKSGPAFNKVPHSRLVAVMRRSADKARDYAARHGVGKWYSDATDLIGDPEVNAVYVATPPGSHARYAIQALRAGKPVYLEKPMALNEREAVRIEGVARTQNVKLSVAHYRRQQPLFLKIKNLLQEKAIGEARLVNLQLFQPHPSGLIAQTEENWRLNPALSGGGLFYDLAPHQLDLMLYFFGTPRQAAGLSFNAAGLYGADDTTSGQVVFENKVLFHGAWCFTAPEKRDDCEIIGTEGKLRFSIFDHQPLVLERQGKQTLFEFDRLPHVQQPMIEKVVEYFLGRGPNPCSAEEGVEVMKMMAAFTRRRR